MLRFGEGGVVALLYGSPCLSSILDIAASLSCGVLTYRAG